MAFLVSSLCQEFAKGNWGGWCHHLFLRNSWGLQLRKENAGRGDCICPGILKKQLWLNQHITYFLCSQSHDVSDSQVNRSIVILSWKCILSSEIKCVWPTTSELDWIQIFSSFSALSSSGWMLPGTRGWLLPWLLLLSLSSLPPSF